ncbi:DUF2627 domain-containing protein [Desertibacillus haloalkaliphilus]|uniref:DUF2627 domain-containing protein n=1 Tax=Desertibacillus haloalkaliphilus TaxID=1328930 RepID=UPI001C27C2EE|nr:DUF2627 domain-containing protein [Desertibacillus haloalkaliphilus]MBU8907749.1 DUF2627 domain-containing protein [Desertibacillus haloalkaliphilus]
MRFIALLVLLIPGFIAGFGIKLMRDVFFNILHVPFPALWLQFFAGLIAFVLGLGFVGGFIFYRDRKNNKVAPKYQKKA